jgi:hypothetical protein
MRVMTACAFSVGFLAVVAQADRPHVRDAKGSAVTFYKASSQPAEGLRKETLANGQIVYVSSSPVANAMDILEATDTGNGMNVRLSGDAVGRLAGGQMAVYIDSKLVAAGPVTRDCQVTLGRLAPDQAERISRLVQGQPVPVNGPVLTVVPAGQRDGLYLVDVFVQGVDDLRTYQVSLLTGGGNSGRIELENVFIDKQRADYLFSGAQVTEASSPRTGWLVAVLNEGTGAAAAPRYLGTYAFRPTADANGTFRVNVNLGDSTILANQVNEPMTYSAGADARIMIGTRPQTDSH